MAKPRRDGFPSGHVRDVLAGERTRARQRRSVFRFLFGRWPLGLAVGSAALLLFAFFWFRGTAPPPEAAAPSAVSSEAGRDLTPAEVLRASSFGRPLYLGESGRPVVRHALTGEVRQLTPFEQQWDYRYPARPTGVQDILESPGPRGYGVWWRERGGRKARQSYRALGRHDWRERQQEELAWVVGVLDRAAITLFSWHGGYQPVPSSIRLARVLEPLPARYPHLIRSGLWAEVPGRWRCDVGLESALSQGVTPGCPTPVYDQLLEDAWVSVGLLLEDIYQARSILSAMDPLDSLAVAGSGYPDAYRLALLDVARSQDRLDASLRVLWARSAAEDLPLFVELP